MRPLTLLLCALLAGLPRPGFSLSDKGLREHLDLNLGNVERHARTQRYWGGGILLGAGLFSGAGALLAHISDNPDTRSTGAIALGVVGGVFAVSGTLILLFPTDYEKLPEVYQALPEATPEQLHTKVLVGEDYLRQLSQRARRERIISSLLGLGGGGAYLAIAANTASSDTRNWMIFTGAAIAVVGLADLLTERVAEREWDDFRAFRARERKASLSPGFRISPTPGGAAALLAWHF